jgi:methionyl-tRNA synthetase
MSWGIELPFDADYVTYVWVDALLNYLTGIGYNPASDADQAWRDWWPAQYHIIGKDILTTHAVYWSTMLLALGIPLMQTLYAHGWWTSNDGAKMSKSLGNTIDVALLTEVFGVDATRYFFMREIAFGADGGFSYEAFLLRYNADLANDLGNLAHRGLSMTAKWLGGKVPLLGDTTEVDHALRDVAEKAVLGYEAEIEQLHFSKALDHLWSLVRAGNKYIDDVEPWALNKAGDTVRLATVKRHVLEVCHLAALMLVPVLPTKSRELLAKLGRDEASTQADIGHIFDRAQAGKLSLDMLVDDAPLEVGDPLFPRFREMPDKIAALFATSAEADPHATKKPSKRASKKDKYKSAAASGAGDGLIDIAAFAQVKLRTGKVLTASPHPNADKLLVLSVDIGEAEPRQIVAGIAGKFSPEQLVGRRVVVVANLAPAKLRGVESQGMLLAAGDKDVIDLVTVAAEPGEVVR